MAHDCIVQYFSHSYATANAEGFALHNFSNTKGFISFMIASTTYICI